jgi:hypothetical protein
VNVKIDGARYGAAMRRTWSLGLMLALAAAGTAFAGCQGEETTDEGPPDTKLATIELGHPPAEKGPILVEIGAELGFLEGGCTENTREQLADMTSNVISTLKEDDIDLKPTQVLDDALVELHAYALGRRSDVETADLFADHVRRYRKGEGED